MRFWEVRLGDGGGVDSSNWHAIELKHQHFCHKRLRYHAAVHFHLLGVLETWSWVCVCVWGGATEIEQD